MPLLAALVDARHVAAYGAVYAIAQAAVALAYFVGEIMSMTFLFIFTDRHFIRASVHFPQHNLTQAVIKRKRGCWKIYNCIQ